jgi:hypothetical protein
MIAAVVEITADLGAAYKVNAYAPSVLSFP